MLCDSVAILEWDDCIFGAETRRLGFGGRGEGRTEGMGFRLYFWNEVIEGAVYGIW